MTEQITQSTVADKLAERIKSSELGALIDGEDLDRIARDAIERAFFQQRYTGNSYNRQELPPLLVEMAQEQFRATIAERLKPVIDDLLKNDQFTTMLLQAISANIPLAARDCAQSIMYGAVQIATDQFNNQLPDALRSVVEQSLTRRA